MEHNLLRLLKHNESAVIVKIQTSHVATKRLADIGFVQGTRVIMVRPGKPCIVKINSMTVGLGEALQNSILVDGLQPEK